MMTDILDKQHIRRRSKSSFFHSFHAGQNSFGGGFVGQIHQKPAHARFGRKSRPALFNMLKRLFSAPSRLQTGERRNSGSRRNFSGRTRSRSQGFSFPVPSLMTVAVIAGVLTVSLIALNWPGLGAYSLAPESDGLAERNLASYVMPAVQEIPAQEALIQEEGITPESLDEMETFSWSSYQVQRGDSVSKIAANFGISMDAVITSNDISNARRLREGETLKIPNIDGIPYTVKQGDSLSKISASMKVPLEVILDVNDIRSDTINAGQTLFIPGARMAPEALKLTLGELFIYPVRKSISSNYGWRADPITGEQRFHAALDLRGSIGTTIKAAMDGTVAAVVSGDTRGLGNYIILKHANGYRTVYGHLSAFSVKQGERVIQGDKIGEVGNTGRSTGPHLHFQIYKDGRTINPLDLLH